jgi:hypothetical protein
MLHAYNTKNCLNKKFAKELELGVTKSLREGEKMDLEELALVVTAFCKSRSGSRDFHKLLEMTVLVRLNDLDQRQEILFNIGKQFEQSGLCSLDTLKIVKERYLLKLREDHLYGELKNRREESMKL